MSTATIQTVSLLPVYFQTDRNSKFLSSTIDQLIQQPQLEKLNAYVGSTSTPTYVVGDTYVQENSPLRQAYQLDPALIVYDKSLDVKSVVAIDDLVNEISINGGKVDNFDRLFRSEVYSFEPHIDWDKLVNYRKYFWMPTGPGVINIEDDHVDVEVDVIGKSSYSFIGQESTATYSLINGMIVSFSGAYVSEEYRYKEYYVEGVGESITLIPYNSLVTPEKIADTEKDSFDTQGFSKWYNKAPIDPEYVTIGRASKDNNPWSRYNRWFSSEVIEAVASINRTSINYPENGRAKFPIIEFKANIQLFNFGSVGKDPVDLVDTTTVDAFNTIEGSQGPVYIDGVLLEYGQRVIFAADTNLDVRSTIYFVEIVHINGFDTISLQPADTDLLNASVVITKGNINCGTSWWFNGKKWIYSQQHTKLNDGPLFDLFDVNGLSYSDKKNYTTNWGGNKIFGYKIGTGEPNKDLGFPLSYSNLTLVGSYLFYNYFANDIIVITENNQKNISIPTSSTYFKIGSNFYNTWGNKISPPIEINSEGYYDLPLSLTNNPLNSGLTNLTLSDLTEHYLNQSKLIASYNPISFAMMFIGKSENSVIDAIVKTADAYNQFKFSLLTQAAKISPDVDHSDALDQILKLMSESKTKDSPFYLSDMLGYGTDKKTITHTVFDSNVVKYSLTNEFNLEKPSTRSVLVYLDGFQLTVNVDYEFDLVDSTVTIKIPLEIGSIITINEYRDTNGSFVPPTPTKLGLYPSYRPMIFEDHTYTEPRTVIQGHDGSINLAYGDYRDDILLEFELRVFNNLKTKYRPKLLNIDEANPGAFRDASHTSRYSLDEINGIIEQDFIRWSGIYGIDFTSNFSFNDSDPRTWNYYGSYNELLEIPINGSWRAIFKYFYDTDRPGTHPWEMVGFTIKPDWWDDEYGPAPYTSGNAILWGDLELGRIPQGERAGIRQYYARPGLSSIIPVDVNGNQLDLDSIPLIANGSPYDIRKTWVIGDQGPAETVWRRSSFWPFVVQKLLALTHPASYCALMYDPINMNVDLAGQWSYGESHSLPQLAKMPIHGENGVATTGYSVFVSEMGKVRSSSYIADLREDLDYVNFQLFHKVGGFISKDSIQVKLDAYEPTSTDAGGILPNQNYKLILNTSNPIRSTGISGLIIQRSNGKFLVTGYDRQEPYFTCYTPIRNSNTPSITVGGISAPYVTWASAATTGQRGLTNADLTTANAAPASTFYQQGQIVQYGSTFYRVTVSHQAEVSFNPSLYVALSELPTVGGATAQTAYSFDKTPVKIPYGQTFETLQDVYDLIVGYGAWLTDQGFVFDQFNNTLETVIDWDLTSKEFLYWTTQNWINNSILSLSPFADQLKYQYTDSVVDNVFDSFYDYSIYTSEGTAFPKKNLFIGRESGVFTMKTVNTGEGIYHARLNSVQKEHGMIFDNTTAYGDVVYNIETGQRQRRMKFIGFRTSNWNGDFFAPGFVYDEAKITTWKPFANYYASDIVMWNGRYYSAKANVEGVKVFDYTKWTLLQSKPTGGLIPNFDYKIRAFNDFYSLDIDSFDANQQQAAQNLVGYIPRNYLNNIFTDPISQYKFYQGFIKEKGTRNPIDKISKASVQNLNSKVEFNEEWALRVGQYGSFTSYKEYEVPLQEGKFAENPQIVGFVNTIPSLFKDLVYYVTPSELTIGTGTIPNFVTTSSVEKSFKLSNVGYAQLNDVTATAYDITSLVTSATNTSLSVGDTIWVSSTANGDWDVLRYTFVPSRITNVVISVAYNSLLITTDKAHSLTSNDIVSIVNIDSSVDGFYAVESTPSPTQFIVSSGLSTIDFVFPTEPGLLFTFKSSRVSDYDNFPADQTLFEYPMGTKIWVDSGNSTDNDGWIVYEKSSNYNNTVVNSFGTTTAPSAGQALGYSISKRKGNDVVIIGLPTYTDSSGNSGRVAIYKKSGDSLEFVLNYPFSTSVIPHTEFGHSVVYDDKEFNNTTYGLIFAGAPGSYNSSGTVQVSSVNASSVRQQPIIVITNPNSNTKRFGSSIFVQRNTSTKLVLIGAPDAAGTVYQYTVTATNTLQIGNPTTVSVVDPLMSSTTTNWGYSIVGSDDATKYAISAPGYANNSGTVFVHNVGLITSPFGAGHRFGQAMAMSQDGSRLAIAAPLVTNSDGSYGAVAVYTATNGTYTLDQILTNPVDGNIFGVGLHFGSALDFNEDSSVLVISALGTATNKLTTFDLGSTTFDLKTTYFTAEEPGSGSVYLYEKKRQRYVYSEELITDDIAVVPGSDYGTSVVIDSGSIIVGAPAITSGGNSGVYQFNQIEKSYNGWNPLRIQDNLIVLDNLREIKLIDNINNDVIGYYDYHDPIKGKILGIAEKELTFKAATDPAIYYVGTSTVSVNVNTNWADEHVGELWWDLSSARFIWYEQGDLEYRRNNWGKLFPGSTIDVYEWVGSTLLPSEWAAQADTTIGLSQGISGQPKFPDNSTFSLKQVYDSITGSFSNYYYYWVKSKVTVPNTKNRSISAFDVANVITNPTAMAVAHAAIISENSLMLGNVATELVANDVSLNISFDINNSNIPKHTEWVLVREGDNNSIPPALLERKMIESLLGHTISTSTNAGALVPDPALSERTKYGIDFRPQQTLFKDRLSALRTVVEFANDILKELQVTGNYSFDNLNRYQPAPTEYLVVEDIIDLSFVDPATTSTVTVLVDDTYNGGWTVFEYNSDEEEWVRIQTQSFNTKMYWNYSDWQSAEYVSTKLPTYTVNEYTDLSSVTLVTGQYVKVKNRGDGNYIILEKVESNGNYGDVYNLVYIENGTIQISDALWNSPYGWDETYGFDQTSWDQTPDNEIYYILIALKEDIFIKELKAHWNKIFFKAIKYAFTEHTLIDWAFKTSFIKVMNFAGNLGQPPVYKLQDSNFYEEYLNEVKPYRTQIREFVTEYAYTDTNWTGLTDFDGIIEGSNHTVVPFRAVTGSISFDRISTMSTLGNLDVTDNFIGTGGLKEFELSWVAYSNKSAMTVNLDGHLVLPTEYTIRYYTAQSNGYNKQFSSLKFLNFAPALGSMISITYKKSTDLMDATDRIINFYSPSTGMPGNDLDQLMVGVTDPRKSIGGQYEGSDFGRTAESAYGGTSPDSFVFGGTFSNGILFDAKGIDPADLTMDGGMFIPTGPNQALEEIVPGYVADTLGIDVYTKSPNSSPTILSGSFGVLSKDNTSTTAIEQGIIGYEKGLPVYGPKEVIVYFDVTNPTFVLPVLPTTVDSIFVTKDGIEFTYTESTSTFTVENQFTIDWVNSSIIIPPQTHGGLLGYTIIGVGDRSAGGVGLVDNATAFGDHGTQISVTGLAYAYDITNSYVTVNGVPIKQTPTSGVHYTIGPKSTRNKRVTATVYNLDPNKSYAVRAWFFIGTTSTFNIIQEQVFPVPAISHQLNPVPGLLNSPSSEVIIERIDGANNRTRLLPPDITYYTVTDPSIKTYKAVLAPPKPGFSISTYNTNVYLNGVFCPQPEFYQFAGDEITFLSSVILKVGDVVAVEAFNGDNFSISLGAFGNTYTYDYVVTQDGNLFLTPNVPRDGTIKVITFANQDSLMLETQRFVGNPAGTYRLARPALNTSYVWVTIVIAGGTISLTSAIDYEILEDRLTVKIGEHYKVTEDDRVIIMSFGEKPFASTVLGYRQFNSFLGGSSFSRLSKINTTYLTQPLGFTNTEIVVADPTVLTPPVRNQNIPGVVLINGERIEYFNMDGNKLTQLRRGTLGTSPANYLESGTYVIDQGTYQTIPYGEAVLIQNTFTNALTSTYVISTVTQIVTYPNTSTVARSDGISLMTTPGPLPFDTFTGYTPYSISSSTRIYSVSTASIAFEDQIQVYYAGRLLNKAGRYYHDTSVRFDSISETQIVGTTSTVAVLPWSTTTTVGSAYLVTATNQVWVYEGDRTGVVINRSTATVAGLTTATTGTTYLVTSTNKIYWSTGTGYVVTATFGYVDSGLRYEPAEFSIVSTVDGPAVVLNFTALDNAQLTFVKRQYTTASSWNDVISITETASLLDSSTDIAKFLQDGPAVLPDRYFYGGK